MDSRLHLLLVGISFDTGVSVRREAGHGIPAAVGSGWDPFLGTQSHQHHLGCSEPCATRSFLGASQALTIDAR